MRVPRRNAHLPSLTSPMSSRVKSFFFFSLLNMTVIALCALIVCWCSLQSTSHIYANAFVPSGNRRLGMATALHVGSIERFISSTPDKITTEQERAEKAKHTWETVALQETKNSVQLMSLNDPDKVTVYDPALFNDFQTTIRGTYFVNGLSSCRVGNRLIHPFEAHGFVKSLQFDGNGNLLMKKSIIETPLTKMERFLNRPIARGVMSSLVDDLNFPSCLINALSPTARDTANLVATIWPPPSSGTKNTDTPKPMLVTATDNGLPYVLDPNTLQTLGSLTDKIPHLKHYFDGKKFLAHSRYDEVRQRWILCTNTMSLESPDKPAEVELEFFEIDASFQVVSSRSFRSRFCVVHDWMITDNYYVIPMNPASMNWRELGKFILGMKLGTDIFDMERESSSEIILIPRHDPRAPPIIARGDRFFDIFHFGSVHEDKESNEVVVYASVFDNYKFGGETGFDGASKQFDPIRWGTSGDAPAPRLDKFTISLPPMEELRTSGKNTYEAEHIYTTMRRERIPLIDKLTGLDIPVDMPSFLRDGIKCRYNYFTGAARPEGWFPFRSIVKVDHESHEVWNWDAGDDGVVSEPQFLPRPHAVHEDDGFLVSVVHNADEEACRLIIWDSSKFEEGPIASVNLGDLMPWCIHGSWWPDFVPEP